MTSFSHSIASEVTFLFSGTDGIFGTLPSKIRNKMTSAWRPFLSACIGELFARQCRQTDCIIEFAIREQTPIGRDH
jgi:hypothetical protein